MINRPGLVLYWQTLNKYYKLFKQEALNYLSPPSCINCQAPGLWICRSCNLQFDEPPDLACPGCKKRSSRLAKHGVTCRDCHHLESPLDQLIYCFNYESKIFHSTLAGLKEDSNLALAPFLLSRFVDVCLEHLPFADESAIKPRSWAHDRCKKDTLIIPIPASSKKFRQRGFNQAALIAEALSKKINLPLQTSTLACHNRPGAQKNLGLAARRANLKDVFYIKQKSLLKARQIILVDDVATSLATLETCATLLKRQGAASIIGCTLTWAQ